MVRLIAEDDDKNQDHLSTHTNIIITICLCSGQPLVKLIAEDEDKNQGHKFRIMAENMFGVSEPSHASMAATTKEPLPFINYENFGEWNCTGFIRSFESLVKALSLHKSF